VTTVNDLLIRIGLAVEDRSRHDREGAPDGRRIASPIG
jgi:hypothetical protein